MKFNVHSNELVSAVSKVVNVTPTRSTLPILGNLYFDLKGRELNILGTDLEVYVYVKVDVEGKLHLAGLIRDAKDAQRMYNYWVTAETEQVALMPKAPYIMEEGQVEGHEVRWQQANQKSFPYLLYKASSVSGKPAPPPQRQPFAGPPQGAPRG